MEEEPTHCAAAVVSAMQSVEEETLQMQTSSISQNQSSQKLVQREAGHTSQAPTKVVKTRKRKLSSISAKDEALGPAINRVHMSATDPTVQSTSDGNLRTANVSLSKKAVSKKIVSKAVSISQAVARREQRNERDMSIEDGTLSPKGAGQMDTRSSFPPIETSPIAKKIRRNYMETLMMAAAVSLSWSDLPPELLGLVLKRLPSLADRVRLRAVCKPWRSNARLQSPSPSLPWLTLLDGTFLSIPDGEIIRMAVPDDAHCYGSIDNWLLLMQIDGGCSLMNPFSKATLGLPKLTTVWRQGCFNAVSGINPLFYKLVVPSPLESSPESLVAVLILDNGNFSTVCICQPPFAIDLFRERGIQGSRYLYDVAFFNGKLYGVAFGDRLIIFEIGYDLGGKPKISSTECIINSWDDLPDLPQSLSREEAYMVRQYLVECCGRLLKVTRFIHSNRPWSTSLIFGHDRTLAFDVFEADLSTNPGHWRRVTMLGGQALFVGMHCSKCFTAEEYNGIQENCIYFMCDYPWPDCAADPLRDSGVYNMRNGMITPLLSQTAQVPQHHGGQWRPTWIFPTDSV